MINRNEYINASANRINARHLTQLTINLELRIAAFDKVAVVSYNDLDGSFVIKTGSPSSFETRLVPSLEEVIVIFHCILSVLES